MNSRTSLLLNLAGLFTIFLMNTNARAGESAHRFVLTDSGSNQRTESLQISHRDLPDTGNHPWSVEKTTLHGGRQEGVELITIDNGSLKIRVIPTRGMGILDVHLGKVRLGWNSPVKEVVHPQYVDLDSRGGLGWLEGFNEWMVRCGLEFAGHPGTDVFTTNTGDEAQMALSLHGKIANIPASHVEVLVDKEPPHRIRVRGVVHERMFYGPKLKLVAEVSTVPGSDEFRISDTVTNQGAAEQEFEVIYHGNYGRPILEKGAKIIAPAKKIAPMNDHAAKELPAYKTYADPTLGFIEEVYLIHPYGDSDDRTTILLRNAEGDVGTSVSWSIKELPYLTVWKNTAAEADGYVTGLEPGTCFPYNRRIERREGRLPKLAAGETRSFTLDFGIQTSRDAVAKMEKKVSDILGGRDTEVQREPTKID